MDFIYGKKVNVKKIVIFESGSDFAAINFDVLNSYFGSLFLKKKKQWTNLKTKERIAEKRKTTEETESKPSNPKLVKKN